MRHTSLPASRAARLFPLTGYLDCVLPRRRGDRPGEVGGYCSCTLAIGGSMTKFSVLSRLTLTALLATSASCADNITQGAVAQPAESSSDPSAALSNSG